MGTLIKDLRYGLRMLLRNPGFTTVAVLTLGLGVGANTALFSVVDAVLLKKLQVNEPERLVLFGWNASPQFKPGGYSGSSMRDPKTGVVMRTSFPVQTLNRFREQQSVFSDVFAYGSMEMNFNADGQAEVVMGQAVSGNYYQGLGVPAFLGRTLTDNDDKAGSTPVAVITHRYWERRFGSDRNVVGRQINLNNVPFTVIGVTPKGFEGTNQLSKSAEVSIPLSWEPAVATERSRMKGAGVWWLRLMARMKPGVTVEQARAAFENVFQQSALEHRQMRQSLALAAAKTPPKNPTPPLEPKDYPHLFADSGSQGDMNARQYFQRPLRLLWGVVGLVLLIACANVANLLLVRASSRRKEIAVRLAVGASRLRLVRQLLTESIMLAAFGGGLGILFALWLKDSLFATNVWVGSDGSPITPQLDLRVLGFTLGLTLLTGIVFGLLPALRATRVDLTPSLKDSGRGSSAASRSFLSKALVVAQVSMSMLLLIGAGLLCRTLLNLQNVETGFNANNLLLFRVEPGLIGYKDERLKSLYQQLSERLEGIPGVRSVTFSREPLLGGGWSSRGFYLPGTAGADDSAPQAERDVYVHQVRENFLEAMETPLLLGRHLSAQDDARAPRVAVVNQSFARTYFPNENPIGKRFGFDSDKTSEVEIVGVAGDAKYARQRDETVPTVYLSWLQELKSVDALIFEVRTEGDPAGLISAIRQGVRDVDSTLPLIDVKTQVKQAEETLAMERLFAKLLSLFGLLAQQLAAIGLYGVLAYTVSERTHEIGIRMALGANRGNVLKMILRQGLSLALIGVALGVAGAYVLTRYLASLTTMLYGVRPTDPLTYGVTAVLLIGVALLATYVPARRATKVDPLTALRYE